MSKKNPKLPDYATPDPLEIIKTEAKYNRYGMENPYGKMSWTGDPETGDLTNVVEFSDKIQPLADKQLALAMRGAEKDPFGAMAQGVPMLGDIFGGVMGKVAADYGTGGGTLEGMPGKADEASAVDPVNEPESEQLARAMLPKSDWMNRNGMLDAKEFREANGGRGALKSPSGRSSKAPGARP